MNMQVAETPVQLGQAAARDIGETLRRALRKRDHLRLILAAAPSQSEMLSALRREPGIEWQRITAFHMDEYIGLPEDSPQRFANWLRREFVDHVLLERFEPINPGADPEAACQAYAALLTQAPIDLVLLGIGMNGHLAFNDPPADLQSPSSAEVVTLDQMCREQQVLDRCFSSLDEVPHNAITLTVPTLLTGRELFCCVPGRHKRAAVQAMLKEPISGDFPATALRTHPCCRLYLDRESAPVYE